MHIYCSCLILAHMNMNSEKSNGHVFMVDMHSLCLHNMATIQTVRIYAVGRLLSLVTVTSEKECVLFSSYLWLDNCTSF